MAANPCAVVNVIANDYFKAVTAINRKFNALQRLAELLEQLGDIQGALPNISALVPLFLISVDTYSSLVLACPFLNLPPHPTDADLAKLQAQVASAYARLIQSLNLHPFIRLDKLQAQMDKVQFQLNEILNDGAVFMQCLQQACASGSDVAALVNNFQSEFDQFQRNYIGANKQVLTQTMQGKVLVVRGMIDNLNELLTTAPVVSPAPPPLIEQVPIPFNHPIPPPPDGPVPG